MSLLSWLRLPVQQQLLARAQADYGTKQYLCSLLPPWPCTAGLAWRGYGSSPRLLKWTDTDGAHRMDVRCCFWCHI